MQAFSLSCPPHEPLLPQRAAEDLKCPWAPPFVAVVCCRDAGGCRLRYLALWGHIGSLAQEGL